MLQIGKFLLFTIGTIGILLVLFGMDVLDVIRGFCMFMIVYFISGATIIIKK